jgi:uncharacterized protein (TIGR02611 family)
MRLRERADGFRQRVGEVTGEIRLRAGGYRTRVRSTRAGRVTLQVATAVVGSVIVVVGIILIPFPGPGWLIVLTGLAILAIEFVWAQRLLSFTRQQLQRWWQWVLRQNAFVRTLVALSGMAFVTGVVLLTLWLTFDVTSPSELWNFLRN